MEVILDRKNDAVLFEARNEGGNLLTIDGSPDIGGVDGGFRPMQLLLAGIGGCSAMDAVSILKKQKQEVRSLRIRVTGEREKKEFTSPFRSIHILYEITGHVDEAKARKAVSLGVEKYCSVGDMLGRSAQITWDLTIRPGGES